MSKLGDLIVRLRLDRKDYEKGLKKADKDTKGFAAGLGKMKAGALAIWGAIGGAVLGFGKTMIDTTNRVGDAWNRFTAQAKAGWDVFVQSVSTMNWDNFVGRIREATSAAKELQNALDFEFEASNSIRLQKAAMADELAELEVLARDQTKSYQERAKAAETYLNKVKPLYDQELDLAKSLEDAQLGKWLAGSGLADSEQVRKDLRKFLVDYGKDKNLGNALAMMVDANSKTLTGSTKLAKAQLDGDSAYIQQYRGASQFVADYQRNYGYGTSIYDLARIYETMRGDADTKPLVDAMIAAGEAAAAFDRETKRMQSALNTSLAQIYKSGGGDLAGTAEKMENAVEELRKLPGINAVTPLAGGMAMQMSTPGIDVESYYDAQIAAGEEYMAWYQSMVDRTASLNMMLEDSIVQATVGGLQAFTDMIAGIEGADASSVLSALLQPFANTATQLGTLLLTEGLGIKAFKESLKTLNPGVAIAAGAALIALGAALGSAIRALGSGGGSGGSAVTSGGYNSGSSSGTSYMSELTVNIKGKLKGSDILVAEDRTRKKLAR